MNRIFGRIYIGTGQDARDHSKLKAEFIGSALCVAEDMTEQVTHREGFISAHCPLIDGSGNNDCAYRSAVEQLENLILRDRDVLVYCHMGQSRSVAVVLCWLRAMAYMSWDDGLQLMKSKRPQANPLDIHKLAYERIYGKHRIIKRANLA